jgi:hypothetical protein
MKKWFCFMLAIMVVALVGCVTSEPGKGADKLQPREMNTNFVLYVSNQSFALTPVDITITIDGKQVISSEFEVGEGKRRQHNWINHGFELTPGPHKLVATTVKGEAKIEKEFEIKDEKHWAVINYWYNPKQDGKKHFTFQIQNEQIYFE